MCFAVTAKLICAFIIAQAKIRFSHDAAHLMMLFKVLPSEGDKLVSHFIRFVTPTGSILFRDQRAVVMR